jgi:hypothetical protein
MSPPTPKRSVRALALALAAAALLCAVSWLHLGKGLERPDEDELYGDETCWVAISILHWNQVAHGALPAGAELDPPQWQGRGPWELGVQRTAFGYPSPCLPKLVWGAALDVAGFHTASPLVFTAFVPQDVEGARAARKELESALPVARRIVLGLACVASVLVAGAACAVAPGAWGWLAAVLASALWLASPIVRATARDARTDFFMLACVVAALVLALKARAALAGERGTEAQWGAGLALGLLCGLCVSSKLNGAPLCLCAGAWIVMLGGRRGAGWACWSRGPGLALLLAALATCAVFWAVNPRLHAEPIAGVADILARWRELFAYFRDDWAPRSGTATAHTPAQSAALFLSRTIERDDPRRARTGLPGGALLACAGLAALAWRAVRAEPDAARAPARVLLAFAVITLAATALWLPIDWPRYYLTAVPALAICQAAACTLALRSAALWLQARRRAARSSSA